QLLTLQQRIAFANDPLELLAVDGNANQAKGDGDAATWLPANKAFRCQYVARQIAVKAKYGLWVTQAEKEAMQRVLRECPEQTVPGVR
ncbi:MAG: HNH endonuclease, partial [Candidatus Saccharibacteria bacterium]|nr:HNH endonuclease [Candidatus Saccharibacteria bacterium]